MRVCCWRDRREGRGCVLAQHRGRLAAFRRRIELLQDFEFTTASQRVKMSRDGNYVVVTGVPRQMSVVIMRRV